MKAYLYNQNCNTYTYIVILIHFQAYICFNNCYKLTKEESMLSISDQFSRSVVSDSLRPHESQHARPPCPPPTPGVHWDSRPSIESAMPSSHLILCRPLLLLPPIPPSIRIFSNESTLHMRWPNYWSFSFSITPSKEIPGLMRVGLWRRLSAEELMLLNCGVGVDSWESLGLQGHPTSPFWRRSALGFLWKEWC